VVDGCWSFGLAIGLSLLSGESGVVSRLAGHFRPLSHARIVDYVRSRGVRGAPAGAFLKGRGEMQKANMLLCVLRSSLAAQRRTGVVVVASRWAALGTRRGARDLLVSR